MSESAPAKATAKQTAKSRASKNSSSSIHASRATEPKINAAYANFKLAIKPSKIHRFGVFAAEAIPARRKLIEYTGQRLNRRQVAARSDSKLVYLFTLDKYWTLDGGVGGSGAEFINHSCEPNVRATIIKGHILYFSLRALKKGEELLIDYRFGKDVVRVPCGCGAKNCRGTINLLDE